MLLLDVLFGRAESFIVYVPDRQAADPHNTTLKVIAASKLFLVSCLWIGHEKTKHCRMNCG